MGRTEFPDLEKEDAARERRLRWYRPIAFVIALIIGGIVVNLILRKLGA